MEMSAERSKIVSQGTTERKVICLDARRETEWLLWKIYHKNPHCKSFSCHAAIHAENCFVIVTKDFNAYSQHHNLVNLTKL